MMRISEAPGGDEQVTLRIEGQLVGQWVEELERACERLLGGTKQVVLDVAEVSFIDRKALPALRSLRLRGVTFANSNPFVTEQLKEVER